MGSVTWEVLTREGGEVVSRFGVIPPSVLSSPWTEMTARYSSHHQTSRQTRVVRVDEVFSLLVFVPHLHKGSTKDLCPHDRQVA